MKKLLYAFLCIYSLSQLGFSQDIDRNQELSKMVTIPNSPEAQAFAKYGNTSVSMYSGTPNIAIPIYTHKGRELNLPISLSYDATGIKVEQLATQVGLGWNLNVGGRITRSINGLPDDYNTASPAYTTIWDNAEVRQPLLKYSTDSRLFNSRQEVVDYFLFLKDLQKSKKDALPDYFRCNALGLNDTFVFDINTMQPKALHNPRLKINFTKNANNSIIAWTVTNDDGTQFYFNKYETTQATTADLLGAYGVIKDYNSSWLLTKIISKNKKDTYEFTYTTLGFWNQPQPAAIVQSNQANYSHRNDHADTYPASGGTNIQTAYKIKQQFLSTITHNGKKIVSLQLGTRNDIYTSRKVDQIKIYKTDQAGDLPLKIYDFNYSYFKTHANISTTLANNEKIRLKLDEIKLKSASNKVLNKYLFEYDSPNAIADRTSLSQDYLGYYNGKNNPVLYPTITYGLDTYLGGDRSPDFTYAKRGILTKITYPTGGYSLFEYEPHKSVYNATDAANETETEIVYGNLSLSGGTDPYGYYSTPRAQCYGLWCQDQYPNPPKVRSATFTIAQGKEGFFDVRYTRTGSTQTPGHAYIFKASLLGQNGSCPNALPLDHFINLANGSPLKPIGVKGNYTGGFDGEVYLEAGCYQLILIDGSLGANSTLKVSRMEIQASGTQGHGQIARAGIRIHTIKNYTDTNVLSSEKEYRYTTTYNGNDSSARIIFKPVLSYISHQEVVDPYSGFKTKSFLNRVASSSGGDRPHIGYAKVFEIQKDTGNSQANNGYTEYTFNTSNSGSGVYSNGLPPYANHYLINYAHGKEDQSKVYDVTNKLLINHKTDYEDVGFSIGAVNGMYIENDGGFANYFPIITQSTSNPNKYTYTLVKGTLFGVTSSLSLRSPCQDVVAPDVCLNNKYGPLKKRIAYAGARVGYTIKTSKEEHFGNNTIKTITDMVYDPAVDYQLRTSTTTDSKGTVLKNKLYYPKDYNVAGASQLVAANRLTEAVTTETYENEVLRVSQKTAYTTVNTGIIMPSAVITKRTTNPEEDRLHYTYYNNGNLKESYPTNGAHTVYIWGYRNTLPIATIENATYSQVSSAVSNLQSKSNLDNDHCLDSGSCDEKNLRTALNSLRNSLPSAMVTTYTYDTQIGVTSMTDPSGYTSYYYYDEFNRLHYIKNKKGEVLKEYQYNYKKEALVAQTVASATSVMSGQNIQLSTTTTGGSGTTTYQWTISNANINQVVSTTTGILNLSITNNHAPNFTVQCQVTDSQTQEVITTHTHINVTTSAPPLQVGNIGYTANNYQVGSTVTYTINVTGGSGNFKYAWSKTNAQRTYNYTHNNPNFSNNIIQADCNYFTIKCTVKDLTTNIVKIKTVRVYPTGCLQEPKGGNQ